jgi:hypothetical protein
LGKKKRITAEAQRRRGLEEEDEEEAVHAEVAENAESKDKEEEGTCFPGRKHGTARTAYRDYPITRIDTIFASKSM